jgi:hypothetical protein
MPFAVDQVVMDGIKGACSQSEREKIKTAKQ